MFLPDSDILWPTKERKDSSTEETTHVKKSSQFLKISQECYQANQTCISA